MRTSRVSLRPWEMACVVSGFNSQIQALQFEWAIQNPHLTRHITPEDRISFPTTLTKTSSKTGRTRKRPGRPRTSLKDKLANLHILLRSQYFSKWSLQVRFFTDDAFSAWQKICKDCEQSVREGIPIFLDMKSAEQDQNESIAPKKRKKREDNYGQGGIEGLDITYARYRDILEKGQFLIANGDDLQCAVCHDTLMHDHDLIAICSHHKCSTLFHISCLSKHFLGQDHQAYVIPEKGHCPSCKTLLTWQDLMAEMTLRVRAPKQVEKLLSRRKDGASIISDVPGEFESAYPEDGLTADAIAQLGEDLADEADESETEYAISVMSSTANTLPGNISTPRAENSRKRLPLVVEESDWEGAETVD